MEQKHFSYEGNINMTTRPNKVKVTQVEFLTPARVTAEINGEPRTMVVSVDIINRKAYDDKGVSVVSDALFEHLDEINTLPDDFFAAPEEVYEKAAEAEQERTRLKNMTGENYGGTDLN